MLDNPETALEIEKKIKDHILAGSAAPTGKSGAPLPPLDIAEDGDDDY
jgi:hypothetical protein